jgi:prepilin-type processing-associated H-X9-DG protein
MKRMTALEILVIVCAFVLLGFCLMPRGHGPEARWRSGCKNNLKQIGLALWIYHDQYGSFPPAYIADANGVPMHSWRILLLPYLDQREAYEKYDFNEPWDSPKNREVTSIPFGAYRCLADQSKNRNRTNYVAVIGNHTAWPAPHGLADVAVNSEVIAIIETIDTGIEWAEPRDFALPQMAPHINSRPCCGPASRHKGGVNVLCLDGSVQFLARRYPRMSSTAG